MISVEMGETMIDLSLATLEATAGERMGGQVTVGSERGREGRTRREQRQCPPNP